MTPILGAVDHTAKGIFTFDVKIDDAMPRTKGIDNFVENSTRLVDKNIVTTVTWLYRVARHSVWTALYV